MTIALIILLSIVLVFLSKSDRAIGFTLVIMLVTSVIAGYIFAYWTTDSLFSQKTLLLALLFSAWAFVASYLVSLALRSTVSERLSKP